MLRLTVDGNQLSVLPESLGMLGCLTSLYANDNQLVELPAALGELPRLRELRLSDNQLSPDALCPLARLPSLSVLWLARNGLSEVPGPLCALRALTELDLDANAISTLPADLLRSSTLTTISVDHNPLEFPPADVVARGLDAMRGWLRQRVEPAIPAPTPAFQPQYAHEPAGSVHTPIAQSPLSDAEGWDGSFVFPASR